MTLAITVISYHGVWQATDHRLSRAGEIVADDSIKHVKLLTRDGQAVLAYAGVGRIGKLDISDWVRRLLRGDNRILRDQVNILCGASTRKLAGVCRRARTPLTFSIGGFESGVPTLYMISNRVRRPNGNIVGEEFVVKCIRLNDAGQNDVGVHVEGSGANALRGDELQQLIQGIIRRRAKKPSLWRDMMGAIAEIIKRASEDERSHGTVSKQSVVTYLPAPRGAFITFFFGWPPDVARPEVPHLIGAVDVKAVKQITEPLFKEELAKKIEQTSNSKEKEELENALKDRINEILSQSDFTPTDKL